MSLGVAFFKGRTPPFAIATKEGSFFCGKDGQTFTKNVDEAHFFNTQEEANEGLIALRDLLAQNLKDETVTTAQEKQQKSAKPAEVSAKPNVSGAVKDIVLKILGKPKDFLKIDAINLYDNRYRVNIWVKEDGRGAKIIDNYFIKFTDGQIVGCEPPLNKKY